MVYIILAILCAVTTPAMAELPAGKDSTWAKSDVTNMTVAPKRTIVIVSPQSDRRAGHSWNEDALHYAWPLLDHGFESYMIEPQSRDMLDQEIRKSVTGIPAGAVVAIFVTGRVFARDGDLFIPTTDTSPNAKGSAEIDGETIRLSFVLRRVTAAAPKEIVAVLDDCDGMNDTYIPNTSAYAIPVDIVCVNRRETLGQTDLMLRIADLLTEEGFSFKQFSEKLQESGQDGSLDVKTSERLSQSFYFVESGYFERIEDPCKGIAIGLMASEISNSNLLTSIKSCQRATGRWPNAKLFREKLAAGLEQKSFMYSIKSCTDMKSRIGYISEYPNGRYIREASAFLQKCNLPTANKAIRP